MAQQLENISAWMDGEQQDDALIGALSEDRNLAAKWQRYHLIRQGLRKELPAQLHLDISDKIAAALEQQPAIVAPKPSRRQSPLAARVIPLFKQGGQMAIAASVAVAVIIGVQQTGQPEDAPYNPVSLVNGLPLGNMSPVSLQQTRATGRLEAEDQHRLINAYLNDHHMQLRMKADNPELEKAQTPEQEPQPETQRPD